MRRAGLLARWLLALALVAATATQAAAPPPPPPLMQANQSEADLALDEQLELLANKTGGSQELIEDETSWDKGVRLVVIGLYSVVFVIGVCGNALIMTVISRSKRDTTVTDIFIGNLAAADILLLLGLVFLNTTMSQRRWIFGSLACKVSGKRCAQLQGDKGA